MTHDGDITENRRRELAVSRERLADIAFRREGMERTRFTLTIRDADPEHCFIEWDFGPPPPGDGPNGRPPTSMAAMLGKAALNFVMDMVRPSEGGREEGK